MRYTFYTFSKREYFKSCSIHIIYFTYVKYSCSYKHFKIQAEEILKNMYEEGNLKT